MNPHMKRWITGVIAVPILFTVIAYGSEALFAALIIGATLLGMAEYNRMVFGPGLSREKIETMVIALLILLSAAAGDMTLLVTVLTFAVMAVLMLNLLRFREQGPDMTTVGGVILGILYIPLLMSHFILIRQDTSRAFSGSFLSWFWPLPGISPPTTSAGRWGRENCFPRSVRERPSKGRSDSLQEALRAVFSSGNSFSRSFRWRMP